jgi:hypothetical protein
MPAEMRRLARHLFTFCSAASLLVCLVFHAVWMRGLFVQDRVTFMVGKQWYVAKTLPHQLRVEPVAPWLAVQAGNNFIGGGQYGPGAHGLIPRLERDRGLWSTSIPYWLPELFTLFLPMVWVRRRRRARLCRQRGMCPT